MAIESLVKLGFLRHAEKHTRSRPRYELVAWCEKGRLKVGADADISVFDPARVIDKVTYENPAQYSEGFRYVIVEGSFVVRDGKLQGGIAPGQGLRAQ